MGSNGISWILALFLMDARFAGMIQKAIDACHQAGGGVVACPRARSGSSTVFLKPGDFAASQAVLGSPDLADYPVGCTRLQL